MSRIAPDLRVSLSLRKICTTMNQISGPVNPLRRLSFSKLACKWEFMSFLGEVTN